MVTTLAFPNRKMIRAYVIADYVRAAGYEGCVCFSCGNASAALRERGLYVVDVSPTGDLTPARWWQPHEIRRSWPNLFDATSGHLPAPLMVRLGDAYRNAIGELSSDDVYAVPTGSGETIVCLIGAYPHVRFTPAYDDADPATRRDSGAALNAWVDALAIPAPALTATRRGASGLDGA